MEKRNIVEIEDLDELIRTHYLEYQLDKEVQTLNDVLDALQTINGQERGTLDFVGYQISGNYKFNIDQAFEFIVDVLGWTNEDLKDNGFNYEIDKNCEIKKVEQNKKNK